MASFFGVPEEGLQTTCDCSTIRWDRLHLIRLRAAGPVKWLPGYCWEPHSSADTSEFKYRVMLHIETAVPVKGLLYKQYFLTL